MFRTLAILLLILPSLASAASISLVPEYTNPRTGDTMTIGVWLSTDGAYVNAIEGSISIPNTFSFIGVRQQGSVVPLWVEKPQFADGTIRFAALIPNGYQGNPEVSGPEGNLFTIEVRAVGEGEARFTFISPQAYADDGEGTAVPMRAESLTLRLLESSGAPRTSGVVTDIEPPLAFDLISVDGAAFNHSGRVLVFATQDKASGVLRYEVARSYLLYMPKSWLQWDEAENPYFLRGGDAHKFIFVRAIDAAGNTTMAWTYPTAYVSWGYLGSFGVPVLLAGGLLWLILRRAVRW